MIAALGQSLLLFGVLMGCILALVGIIVSKEKTS